MLLAAGGLLRFLAAIPPWGEERDDSPAANWSAWLPLAWAALPIVAAVAALAYAAWCASIGGRP